VGYKAETASASCQCGVVAYSQNNSSVSSLEAFERVGVFVIHVPLFRPSMGVGIIVIPVCVKSQIVLIDLE